MSDASAATTTIIHRPFGGLSGYRRLTDRASRVAVHAFPMAELGAVTAAGLLATPGAYVMTDGRTVYIGESRRPARRLADHAADREKGFARDVFVVAGHGAAFDKILGLDLQFRLTTLAVEARSVDVMKGLNPTEPDMADDDRATHDRIAADALRLLFDAGCAVFWPAAAVAPAEPERLPVSPFRTAGQDCGDDAREGGPMTIDVSTVPLGAAEFELRYLGLWARGYTLGDRFVVAAGSEIRLQTNDSVDAVTRKRREQLLGAGVLAQIPGVADRRRLVVAVAFPTPSIAAKVACGAHTPSKWLPLEPARAVWLAA